MSIVSHTVLSVSNYELLMVISWLLQSITIHDALLQIRLRMGSGAKVDHTLVWSIHLIVFHSQNFTN